MTSIMKIWDTGDGGALAKTTSVPANRRAGFDGTSTVNAFELRVTGYTWNSGSSMLEEPALQTDEELTRLSKVSPITYSNPVIVLNCTIPKSDIPSSGYLYDWFYQLECLQRTKGVKLLYFTGTPGESDTLIDRYGKRYAGGVWTTDINTLESTSSVQYRYLPVHVKSVGNITDSANRDTINFDITMRLAE